MRQGKRNIVEMVVVGTIASVVGIVGALLIDWFPRAASTQAGPIDTLWDVLLIVSIPIFVLVTIVVVYSVKFFRMRPGEEQKDGEPIHGNTKLEVVWTAIPSILIAGLVVYAYLVLVDIERAPGDTAERQVDVQAVQFAWTFGYDEQGADGEPVRSNELVLPVGEPVRFNVRTEDVLHDFWVPEFRMKIDAVPGLTTRFRVTPDRPGQYTVVCAELCGLGHAFMRAKVTVVTPEEFEQWLAEQGKPAEDNAGDVDPAEVDAKALFVEGNGTSVACGACHTLADAGTSSDTGPNLDEALTEEDQEAIRQMIVDPDADLAEGFPPGIMPSDYEQTLSEAELEALVNYLDKVTAK